MLAAWKNCSSKIRCLTKFNGRQYERELIRVNVKIWEVVCVTYKISVIACNENE